MKNYSLKEFGASLKEFTSQYHHESRCINILLRDPGLCWFTSVFEPLPQHVVIDMGKEITMHKVGIFLHGENNQNPKRIKFEISKNMKEWKEIVESEVEWRGGDHMWGIPKDTTFEGRYCRYTIMENFGGSGAYTTKLYLFGK
ncbi:F5/8 type C domain-containing protein [Aduncisulcus paluster]|uniref:F5/8 type C domain-containing protein n=1 Tax=Aduncisulcus paluster TaxID=2918883 RepID=A0ABQ5JYZ4_9EUKA|nr:F5/8 type C domain-containing protein [Aduncisulcus paluster]